MKFILLLAVLCGAGNMYGQKMSIGTNILGYANLGTLNIEVEYAVGKKWSLSAGAKYNPFSYSNGDKHFRNRQQLYSVGVRFWPWHTYSGWWVAGKVQYQEYSTAGLKTPKAEEGDRYGVAIAAGYSYMVHPALNLEFGIGFWGGATLYSVYDCPQCGVKQSSDVKGFFLPSDIILGISYVF